MKLVLLVAAMGLAATDCSPDDGSGPPPSAHVSASTANEPSPPAGSTEVGPSPPAGSTEVQVLCTEPSAANTSDGGWGCQPSAPERVCLVTNGATVLPDGAVLDGTATCTDACAPNEYSLLCESPFASTGPAPTPDPSLRCRGAGGPEPSNAASYCCPCL